MVILFSLGLQRQGFLKEVHHGVDERLVPISENTLHGFETGEL